MQRHSVPSLFADTQSSIYHYPADQFSNRAVLLLKGLYGTHVPHDDSWDNELISLLQDTHHVVIANSGRLEHEDRLERFNGKTFQQECEDLALIAETARCILSDTVTSWHAAAMSFGGTALLGVPQVLERLSSVLMVGSGCGKSPDTKKPLLSTLPESDSLLNSLIGFTGTFVFLRGSEDTIVPQEAQRRIFESAHHAESRAWIEYKGLDHKLSNGKDVQLARLIAKHVRQS